MPYPIESNMNSYANYGQYNSPTSNREQQGEAIADKTEADIIKNGWRGAVMKNVNDVIRASKGQ